MDKKELRVMLIEDDRMSADEAFTKGLVLEIQRVDAENKALRIQLAQQADMVEKCMVAMNANADAGERDTMTNIAALQAALAEPSEPLCIDEGCDHHGTPHICVEKRNVCRFPDCSCKVYDGNHCEDMATVEVLQSALAEPSEPVALAWEEGYRAGVEDERTSEANIGIAGFGAKVNPARNNPYKNTHPPVPEPLTDEEIISKARLAFLKVQGMSDDEVNQHTFEIQLSRAVEAAIRSKK
jgi:hypothetical protein